MTDFQRLGYSVRALANWILDYAASEGFRHTNMGINKLVFFGVEGLLVHSRALLTDAKIEAWEHGPVFRELYQSFKGYGNGFVTGRAKYFSTATGQFEDANLEIGSEHKAVLVSVIVPLVRLSAAELRGLSHRPGGAWHKTWWYDGHVNPGMEIRPSELIESWNGELP